MNAFWAGRDGQVAEWLSDAVLRHAVSAAFTATDDEELLQVLADIDYLLGLPGTDA